jgi:hypothetical protein
MVEILMSNIIDFVYTAPARCCSECYGQDFSIVEDRLRGILVICDECHAAIGKLVAEDNDKKKKKKKKK